MFYKKISILFILLLCTSGVFAQDLNEAKEVTPDNRMGYFIDRVSEIFEGIPYMFNEQSRAEWALKLANERLLEAKIMTGKGVNSDDLLEEYNINMRMANDNNSLMAQQEMEKFQYRIMEIQTNMEQNMIESTKEVINQIKDGVVSKEGIRQNIFGLN